ncbi:LodA/GoxA family CTQ-dependent oxidase [Paraburkholderia sp. BL17N1]|uniref:LodA/GoxA family CTQ-dependent oxidase n=1 Tax=Paraburkholderia sp. BL17N1 TaxID=1938798 RepID=UPI000F1DB1A8|nr:LodA/GoxA family CTQ-dependent oxidase [Paraburkholderia sp. BL17N1]RKR43224.1 hypothetical protein B0G82_0778 [Paraburkholderia sp. BL17N1]
MDYKIFPPIGIARVGNSPSEFFLGPERAGSEGFELAADGSEVQVQNYKTEDKKTKRQAARFQIYQFEPGSIVGYPLEMPAGARIEWTVRLVNKKDAVERTDSPPPPPVSPQTIRPKTFAGREDRIIDSGQQTVSGASAVSVTLKGAYRNSAVELGEIKTDANQRLIVLGGFGKSESIPDATFPNGAPIGGEAGGGNYYNNSGWHDDVSDGPVTARLILASGEAHDVSPAWVIVAPPDFAPPSNSIVTLFDIIRQIGVDSGGLTLGKPNFKSDIRPLLVRAASLQWVSPNPRWKRIIVEGPALENPDMSSPAVTIRDEIRNNILKGAEELSHDDTDYSVVTMRDWQITMLDRWVKGDFTSDDVPKGEFPSSDEITRTVLDAAIGQTLFPGIEAGVVMLDESIYARPFDYRVSHTAVSAGDLTALMALPWQADFLKCGTNWWPSQRPNRVLDASGNMVDWLRPPQDHRKMIGNVMKMGVVQYIANPADGSRVVREVGRDDAGL